MGQPEREREERIRIPPFENLMTLKSTRTNTKTFGWLVLSLCLFEGKCYWKRVFVCRGDFPCNQKHLIAVHELAYIDYDLDKLRREHFQLWLIEG